MTAAWSRSETELPGWAGRLEAVRAMILDLDGVITDTASLHRQAWKEMFDAYLRERRGEDAEPFTDADYRRYVDGKPRYDGAASFLQARDIDLPRGEPDDPTDRETVCGLGNRKNERFLELLDDQGVEPLEGAVAWIRHARRNGYRTAVVTSSRNGRRVLEAAGIAGLFDARVDGRDGEERDLPGKPDPAYFLAAAGDLGLGPDTAAVVEDSEAGVRAGRRGGFALVVGVAADEEGEAALRRAGANRVVRRLANVPLLEPGDGTS